MKTEAERMPKWIRDRTTIVDGDGCWEWQGTRQAGYGRAVGYDPSRRCNGNVARHLAVAMWGPIPAELFVMHLCDNPSCVRPAHLTLGTARDNSHDALRKGRLVVGGMPIPPQEPGAWKVRAAADRPKRTFAGRRFPKRSTG